MLDTFHEITYRTDLSNYEINKRGEVRSKITNKVLKGTDNRGYKHYTLKSDSGKLVSTMAHVMVANEFIPNPENKPIINHIDENGMNACIDNLEWVTAKENSNHGTCQERSSKKRSYPINQYTLDGKYLRTWNETKCAALVYGVSVDAIINAVRGKTKSATGYIWKKYDGDRNDIDIDLTNNHLIGGGLYRCRAKEKYPILPQYLLEETPDTIISYLQSMPYIPKEDKEMLERLRKMCS